MGSGSSWARTWTCPTDRLTVTRALFQITRQDEATEDPLVTDFSILTG